MMSLKPRYSLLTLLILTALVAGGVKLWYGPYHVVEQAKPEEEVEYSYTRNWRGERVIDGPRIERGFDSSSVSQPRELRSISIRYYRQGSELPWSYFLCHAPNYHMAPDNANEHELPTVVRENDPLTNTERAEYEQAIRRERGKLQPKQRNNIVEYYQAPLK